MVDTELLKDIYYRMYAIRYSNEKIKQEYDDGADIPAGIHGSKGQEAPVVGVCQHLSDDDWVFTHHRSAHAAIAKGVDMNELIAEQFGKAGGVCNGKGGEQHILDESVNFVSDAIIAQQLPLATGVALSHKMRGHDTVVVGFLGEGAANQGAFYECLNFASVFDLPIVFVIEDNQWGISTPKDRVTAVEDNSKRAEGQNMPGKRIEDNDVLTVYEAAGEAIERAREGDGPTLLEIKTYRMMGHFFEDPETYRSERERAEMRRNDCMKEIEGHVKRAGVPDEEVDRIEATVEDLVDEAVHYGVEQPFPDRKLAKTNVFADRVNGGKP